MASQSLYRKWRSQTFTDLVGQEPVVRTLKNALLSGNLAHAYLFTGPRGTGKTSTARLLAKTINCSNPKDGEHCNVCQQCREITAGNSFNVMEIDAASNRGIDSIRELREKVMVPPSSGKYKVYILDEAHMLTVEAFNALLKTLEEPPPHAIFVMATTDVHKMLPTVLSRCQRFDFKRITSRQIVAHLNFVAQQEQVNLEQGAAELIARAASGGMRDALSLLDQAIAYSGQSVALAQVQSMLGVADPRAVQKFILFIAQLDSSGGLHLIHELVEAGADLRQLNNQVAEYWRAMMLVRAGANIAEILDTTEDQVREISEAARLFNQEELIECARVFAQNDLIQKNQGTPQLGLELALLTCLELHRRARQDHPASVVAAASPSKSPATPARPASAPAVAVSVTTPPSPVAVPAPAPAQTQAALPAEAPASPPIPQSPLPRQEQSEPELPDWDELATYADEDEEAPPVASQNNLVAMAALSDAPIDDQAAMDGSLLTIEQVKEKWEYVKRRVRTKKDGAKIAAILNGFVVVQVEASADMPIVVIKANAAFHYNAIQKGSHHETIEWALKIELEQECRLRLLPPGQSVSISTPTVPSSSARAAPVAPARQSARLERPAPSKSHNVVSPAQRDSTLSSSEVHIADPPPPLAIKGIVRENTTVPMDNVGANNAGQSRRETVEKKAKNDPVVQEVARLFKAEIKDIRLK
jgi:DNA polymerase-3 subunit gamma/tau